MQREQTGRREPKRGFTLLELLIVVVIIGIIVAFILTAAQDGVRRSEERATQSLITKLETGLSDRVDALLATRTDANLSHAWLADVFSTKLRSNGPFGFQDAPSNSRAQVIARFDFMKAELPDVFVVQADDNYPLNFAAAPFPPTAGNSISKTPVYGYYALPLGVGVLNNPALPSFGANPPNALPNTVPLPVTGMFGASFTAAAGLYKNLYKKAFDQLQQENPSTPPLPPIPPNAGFDGVDNDNDANQLIDNISENDNPKSPLTETVSQRMRKLLLNHKHKTARSELLYALLVEGQGPFGSVFSPDDFRDSEVKDTDGDGLPEFVDAWGEPLQFYRWPVFYRWPLNDAANAQKGAMPYGQYEARQKDTLDPNQTLMDPFWWNGTSGFNDLSSVFINPSVSSPLSPSAFAFQALFTTITDTNGNPSVNTVSLPPPNPLWDRGGVFKRRSYYSKFLILSGGQDKIPGVPIIDKSYYDALLADYGSSDFSSVDFNVPRVAQLLPPAAGIDPTKDSSMMNVAHLRVESQAAPVTPWRSDYAKFYSLFDGSQAITFPPPDPPLVEFLSQAIGIAGKDDITSYNLQSPGGATQ